MCLGLPFPLDAKCNCLPNTPLCLFRDGQIGDKPTSSPLRPGFAAVPLLWLLFGFVSVVLKRDVTAEDGWPLTSALFHRQLSTLYTCTRALFINLARISSCNFFFFLRKKIYYWLQNLQIVSSATRSWVILFGWLSDILFLGWKVISFVLDQQLQRVLTAQPLSKEFFWSPQWERR